MLLSRNIMYIYLFTQIHSFRLGLRLLLYFSNMSTFMNAIYLKIHHYNLRLCLYKFINQYHWCLYIISNYKLIYCNNFIFLKIMYRNIFPFLFFFSLYNIRNIFHSKKCCMHIWIAWCMNMNYTATTRPIRIKFVAVHDTLLQQGCAQILICEVFEKTDTQQAVWFEKSSIPESLDILVREVVFADALLFDGVT